MASRTWTYSTAARCTASRDWLFRKRLPVNDATAPSLTPTAGPPVFRAKVALYKSTALSNTSKTIVPEPPANRVARKAAAEDQTSAAAAPAATSTISESTTVAAATPVALRTAPAVAATVPFQVAFATSRRSAALSDRTQQPTALRSNAESATSTVAPDTA